MDVGRLPGAGQVSRFLTAYPVDDEARIRQAAWVARCVGRGAAAP
jgi:hypothetical protein